MIRSQGVTDFISRVSGPKGSAHASSLCHVSPDRPLRPGPAEFWHGSRPWAEQPRERPGSGPALDLAEMIRLTGLAWVEKKLAWPRPSASQMTATPIAVVL